MALLTSSLFLSLIGCVDQINVRSFYSFIQPDKNIIFSVNVKVIVINFDSRTTAIGTRPQLWN